MKKKQMSYFVITSIVLAIIFVDQVSKCLIVKNITEGSLSIVGNLLKFTYVENTGGAFGIGSSNTVTIIFSNLIIIALALRFLTAQKERMSFMSINAIIFILGGGISNLADRIIRGHVVDFIDINGVFSFPMFNIADIAVVIGGILLIISTFLYNKQENKRQKEMEEERKMA